MLAKTDTALSILDASLSHTAARAALQVEKLKQYSQSENNESNHAEIKTDAVQAILRYVAQNSSGILPSQVDPIQRSLIQNASAASHLAIEAMTKFDLSAINQVKDFEQLRDFFISLSRSAALARKLLEGAEQRISSPILLN